MSSMQDMIKKGFKMDGNTLIRDEKFVPKPVPINEFSTSDGIKEIFNKKKKKKNKYNNEPVYYNGVYYQSTKEADFAKNLDWKMKAGLIRAWHRQIPFEIIINGVEICEYFSDFKVINLDGSIEYFDVKGYKKGTVYRMFKIKQALVLAIHGIKIIEK